MKARKTLTRPINVILIRFPRLRHRFGISVTRANPRGILCHWRYSTIPAIPGKRDRNNGEVSINNLYRGECIRNKNVTDLALPSRARSSPDPHPATYIPRSKILRIKRECIAGDDRRDISVF